MVRTFLSSLMCLALVACEDADNDVVDTDTDAGTGDSMDAFVFSEDDATAYAQVDRVGMPAVVVALIASKDAYNMASPENDADFADEIVASVQAVHDALDDDLTGAGLTPCEPAACVDAAAPFVIPDVLAIDATQDSGFPNGRRLPDPVMDVTLALVLLDLQTHAVTTLADLPLNPPTNDVSFESSFPYLAPAHDF